MSEFHDLAEIALNSDGQAWGNLGYWKGASDYSRACRALALLLGDRAALDADSVVFDAGFGCGDQLLLWLNHFQIAAFGGVNNAIGQTRLAQRRLSEAGYEAHVPFLLSGDVNDPNSWDIGDLAGRINHVVALDCAYHFPSKTRFFQQAFALLPPSGRIGLTDFVLVDDHSASTIDPILLKIMLRLSRIPAANMIGRRAYTNCLDEAGFAAVEIEDISEQVMPSFGKWWRGYRAQDSRKAQNISWSDRMKYDVTARFLDWAYRKNILRYCIISAEKP